MSDLHVPGKRPQNNPLEVLNAHLENITTALKSVQVAIADHHYMLIEVDTGRWMSACFACSKAAGAAIHPCRGEAAGPVPPAGFATDPQG